VSNDVSEYEILKYVDGDWLPLTKVISSVGQVEYSLNIDNVYSTSIYKIAAIQKDNSVSYSNVVKLVRNTEVSMNLWPNPTSGVINLSYEMSESGLITAQLFDVTGRIVYNLVIPAEVGVNHNTIDLGNLPSGNYTLNILTNDFSYSKLIEKK
jgi:hypothetical protein